MVGVKKGFMEDILCHLFIVISLIESEIRNIVLMRPEIV